MPKKNAEEESQESRTRSAAEEASGDAPPPDPQPSEQPTSEEAVVTGDDGAVIDATPEDRRDPRAPGTLLEKAPLNPYTKAYKQDFPARNQGGEQQAAPTTQPADT